MIIPIYDCARPSLPFASLCAQRALSKRVQLAGVADTAPPCNA